MTGWRPRLVAVAALAATTATLSACGSGVAASPTAAGPQSPVTGIVLSVDSAGLTQVHGFTLRDSAGRQYTFTIGQLENPAEFPPGHLVEHQLTAEPVEVWFRVEAGNLVAYRLADAATGSSASP